MASYSSGESKFLIPLERSSSDGSNDHLIKSCSCFHNSCCLCCFDENLEEESCFDSDDAKEVGVDDDDILELLSMDPFELDIESTLAAFSDWIEDFEWDFQPEDLEFGVRQIHEMMSDNDHLHFLNLSWAWNGPDNLRYQRLSYRENEISVSGDIFQGYQNFDGVFGGRRNFLSIWQDDSRVFSREAEKWQTCTKIECDAGRGDPHDGLFFVLGYLDLPDLLSVEQVCRSLRDAVRGDPLLWKTVHINYPLNYRLRDDNLINLTDRAQGTLRCLILVNCVWISDTGLQRALKDNKGLIKLNVPDCYRITIKGILFNLRALKSYGNSSIKHLRIGGLSGGMSDMSDQQFEELKELLDASKHLQPGDRKPHFFIRDYSNILCEDGRQFDVDMCPQCNNVRPVYDCPAESCQQKHQAAPLCRGCTLCIKRCLQCGRCVKDFYEETVFFDYICLNCLDGFLHCPEEEENEDAEKKENEVADSSITSERTMSQFCLDG
ncbi:unnamed protein product [Sphenostylis stenocarpa]|uniref:F-box domain-containing protein n=1 Tax=Sphenostylis stenocarpa TaxID=92480 RepID=A0AA86SNL5_9FABA|nr:unnamed protein product [Sphenostylis stenocarpa]